MTSETRSAAIRSVIAQYCDAWRDKDRDAWLATFGETATQEDPIGEGVRVGRDAIGAFWDRAHSSYDEIEIRQRGLHVVGDTAALEWTIIARAGEERVVFDGVDVFTFDAAPTIMSVAAYWEREGQRRTTTPP